LILLVRHSPYINNVGSVETTERFDGRLGRVGYLETLETQFMSLRGRSCSLPEAISR
jgi:hypothetical protein